MRALFTLLLIFSSSSLFAQENPLVPADYYKTLRAAKKLADEYKNLNPKSYKYNYLRYQMTLDNIGPITLKSIETISDINKAKSTNRGLLTEESWKRFTQKLRLFNPNNFQPRDRGIIEKASEATQKLRSFAASSDAKMIEKLLDGYKTDPSYGAWRSLKNGMKPIHLGPEILRFATAIAVVRVATCFGGSFAGGMGSILTMKAPSHLKAKNSDPACMEEVSRMFLDPVFYAGFSAFIAGSRFTAGGLNWGAAKLNPAGGLNKLDSAGKPKRQFWFSNLPLMVGFMSDHVVKTLLHNKDIVQCTFSYEETKSDTDKAAEQADIDEDVRKKLGYLGINALKVTTLPSGEEVFDIHGENDVCRRAARHISSDQFLKEELGVGLTSLVTAATALSLAGAGTTSAIAATKKHTPEVIKKKSAATLKKAKSLIKKAKSIMKIKNFSLVLMPTGVAVFAVQTFNLVKFLGVFELLNPFFNIAYHSWSLEPNVENKTDQFIQSYIKSSKNGLELQGKRQCVDVYGATDFRGSVPICSKTPLLVNALSFADFSSTWRSKQILGQFHMSYGRWRQKLMSFITNYISAKDQLKSLARGRELFLTDASEYISNRANNEQERAKAIIAKKYRPGLVDQIYNEILDDAEKHYLNRGNYDSRYKNLSSSSPEYKTFEIFLNLMSELDSVATNQNGELYFGLGYYLSKDEKELLLQRSFENTPDISELEKEQLFKLSLEKINQFIRGDYIEVEHPTWNPSNYVHETESLVQNLEKLKLSDNLLPSPFSFENLKYFINSKDPLLQVMAVTLFRDWMPYMYGTKPRRDNELDDHANPRGMSQIQWTLYNEINPLIESLSPIYPGEETYLMNALEPISIKQKGPEDTQRTKSVHGLDTKDLSNYTLVKMSCGITKAALGNILKPWNWFGDKDGFSLDFSFPRIYAESPCQNMLHPAFEGTSMKPSAVRSVFANKSDLYIGLHDMYIHAPDDEVNPLIFSKEEDASQWWNSNIKPDAEARLKQMKLDYQANVRDQFFPKISKSNLQDGWFQGFMRIFSTEGSKRKSIKVDTAVNSLNLSLKNELYHYGAALSHSMPPKEFQALQPTLMKLTQCIDQLLDSIYDKNYMAIKSQCEEHTLSVTRVLEHQNNRYSDNAISALTKLDEGVLAAQENGQGLLFDRYLIQMSRLINGLFTEIDSYNEMVNESFNFKFGNINQEGENQ